MILCWYCLACESNFGVFPINLVNNKTPPTFPPLSHFNFNFQMNSQPSEYSLWNSVTQCCIISIFFYCLVTCLSKARVKNNHYCFFFFLGMNLYILWPSEQTSAQTIPQFRRRLWTCTMPSGEPWSQKQATCLKWCVRFLTNLAFCSLYLKMTHKLQVKLWRVITCCLDKHYCYISVQNAVVL